MTLFELTDDYKKLLEMAEDPDVDPEMLNDTLEALGGEIEDKADNYAKVMDSLDISINGLKAMEDRFAKKRKAMENKKDKIKLDLENAMRATGKTKFKTDLYSFAIQKNPASVVIDDEAAIPDEFFVAAAPVLDKKSLKEYLKANECPGAHLQQTEGLRIR